MSQQPVRFELVGDDEASSGDPADADAREPTSPSSGTDRVPPVDEPGTVREAERDPYPLAGPILEEARARELRGRCSSCEARLRLRVDDETRGSLSVRCPICGRTDEVET